MNKGVIYGVIGFFIGILFTFVVTSTFGVNNYSMMQMMGRGFNTLYANTGVQTGMMGNIDRHFIEQMIPHHEDAITMAKLAQTKAQHEEMKTLAKSIISSQGKEIDQMKRWYNKWYGKDVPQDQQVMGMHGMMNGVINRHMGMMGNDEDEQLLANTTNFDKAFIEQMIPHHQMAVMMANMLLQGTTRPEMQSLAKNIIAAQTKEINEMRQWYKDWGYEQ